MIVNLLIAVGLLALVSGVWALTTLMTGHGGESEKAQLREAVYGCGACPASEHCAGTEAAHKAYEERTHMDG